MENEHVSVLEYPVTPANRHNVRVLVLSLLSLEKNEMLPLVENFYGDNAYFTGENLRWLNFHEIRCCFHSKEETGKHPKKNMMRRKNRAFVPKSKPFSEIFKGIIILSGPRFAV
ncbi:MAG: hypothetical protein ACTSQS_06275 [Promethearchaeota archaeon]